MMDSDDDDIYPTNEPTNESKIKTEDDGEEEGEEVEDDSDVGVPAAWGGTLADGQIGRYQLHNGRKRGTQART